MKKISYPKKITFNLDEGEDALSLVSIEVFTTLLQEPFYPSYE